MKLSTSRALFTAAALALSCIAVAKDAYPSKPIRIIVPYTPGGVNDILARALAPGLASQLHQSVIVENRPGAGGDLGVSYVTHQPADGYTVLLTSNAVAISTAVKTRPPFDATTDLQPVSFIGTQYMVAVAAPSSPANNISDLVKMAKAKPGTLTCATPGIGTPHHLALEFFKHSAHISVLAVPYQGAAPALTDTMAGRTSFYFAAGSSIDSYIKAGKLKLLGVTGNHRMREYPQAQTFAEAGVPGMDFGIWYGVTVPKGTPPAVVGKLHDAVAAAMKTPAVATLMHNQSINAETKSSAAFGQLIREDVAKLRTLKKEANIKID